MAVAMLPTWVIKRQIQMYLPMSSTRFLRTAPRWSTSVVALSSRRYLPAVKVASHLNVAAIKIWVASMAIPVWSSTDQSSLIHITMKLPRRLSNLGAQKPWSIRLKLSMPISSLPSTNASTADARTERYMAIPSSASGMVI